MQTRNWRVLAAVFTLLVAIGILIWMSSGYSRISDRSYDYALALISACGRQDQARIKLIVTKVNEEDLPDYDRRVILAITDQALGGNWEGATVEARNLLKAQTRSAP